MANDIQYEKIREIVASDTAIQEADRLYRRSLAGDNEALTLGLLRDWYHEAKRVGELATAQVDGEMKGMKKVAKAMKACGISLDMIATCTELSKEQLEAL